MSELLIRSSRGDYTVQIELGAAASALDADIVLMDPVVSVAVTPAHPPLYLAGDEKSKTLSGVEEVLVGMSTAGLRRGGTVAALGGGVIQDVATLACSLYMRGVDWVYVPTTLMAMADSCIGGKSSINAGGVKNLVGNFYPPKRVVVDPVFISSLPVRARVSGLAEAVKICFARGAESFESFLASPASISPDADEQTAALIAHVLASKQWFVEIDEFDKAERQLLNFGHSFGHAFEAACGFRVQHGIGVALGVLAALRHPAAHSNGLTRQLHDYASTILARVRDEVDAAYAATDWQSFRRALRSDKKNSGESLRLILPAAAGSVSLVELPLDDTQLSIAEDALRGALEEIVR